MGERGREMEEDEATLKHGNTMSKKIHPLTKIWRQLQWEDGFFCAVIRTHLPTWALYVSTITSITSPYVCTCWYVSNPRKWHDIDGAENGEKWKMLPNVGPTFSNMSLTCHPTHQCRVEIANADIQQTQLRCVILCNYYIFGVLFWKFRYNRCEIRKVFCLKVWYFEW